jgi:hypothetical protein
MAIPRRCKYADLDLQNLCDFLMEFEGFPEICKDSDGSYIIVNYKAVKLFTDSKDSSDRIVEPSCFFGALEAKIEGKFSTVNEDYIFKGKYPKINTYVQKYYPEIVQIKCDDPRYLRLVRKARKAKGRRQKMFYSKANRLARQIYAKM